MINEQDLIDNGFQRNHKDSWNTMTFVNKNGSEVVVFDDFDQIQCQVTGKYITEVEQLPK